MKVKFGDVVKDVKENVDRSNNPYEFYVAGDHMDSEDFRIHRYGKFATDDVGPAFVRIFHPGQILYGSRRTYLKKVCVADFEGVTANTTFVLETKDENVLLQKLLPFLMLSKGFTDWSIKHSKGSTNPYVLFSDLADYEFDLPPIEKQQELAELLWAANDLKESYKKMIVATDEMLKVKFREMFGECGVRNAECGGFSCVTLPEVVWFQEGPGVRKWQFCDSGVKLLNGTNLLDGKIDLSTTDKYISEEEANGKYKHFLVDEGDLLIASSGIQVDYFDRKICFARKEHLPLCMNTSTIRFKVLDNQVLDIGYFMSYLKTDEFKDQLMKHIVGSCQLNFGPTHLKKMTIPLPPLALQQQFVEIARKADETKAALKKSIADIDQVIKGLING